MSQFKVNKHFLNKTYLKEYGSHEFLKKIKIGP